MLVLNPVNPAYPCSIISPGTREMRDALSDRCSPFFSVFLRFFVRASCRLWLLAEENRQNHWATHHSLL